jgi:hypothetical protein
MLIDAPVMAVKLNLEKLNDPLRLTEPLEVHDVLGTDGVKVTPSGAVSISSEQVKVPDVGVMFQTNFRVCANRDRSSVAVPVVGAEKLPC